MNTSTTERPTQPLSSESLKARLFLFLALTWPLILLVLLASSSAPPPPSTTSLGNVHNASHNNNLRLSLRNALDRVDIMGYGPTHPRVAFVVVGADQAALATTVKSIISHTDLSRIFVIAVVVDGSAHDHGFVAELRAMEAGAVPHWHGMRADWHEHASAADEDEHGRKIHVIFNEEKIGTSASREDAVDFCHLLATYHEEAGFKSEAEDLLLLLLEEGAQFTSHKWLSPVTQALIVPPPLLPHSLEESSEQMNFALKLANAVVFPTKGIPKGHRLTLDMNFAPVDTAVPVEELNDSSGDSFKAPVCDGVALALRLETYRDLPLPQAVWNEHDDAWSANVDVAVALWLCADGMDVLTELEIQRSPKIQTPAGLSPASASRFAAAWMDDVQSAKFFEAYQKYHAEVTFLEWNLWHAHSDAVWRNSRPRCRSFDWYVEKVASELGAAWREAELVTSESAEDDDEDEDKSNDYDDHTSAIDKSPTKKEKVYPPGYPGHPGQKKPSKPLCEECLEIIQRAKPVDLAYVDVSDGHREHPHMGAKDEMGVLGYVHDATHLRQNPPAFNMPQDRLAKGCAKRDNNYRMLTEKVYVDTAEHEQAEKSGRRRDKIFCLVYTTEKGHSRIPRIRETWGQKCDGFMVGSTKTDRSLDTVEILHEGPEEYDNIWQKVRSMWAYIYDNYYQDGYDWFHIGGDDLYLIVENLRLYLESEEIRTASNGGIYLPDGSETSQIPLFLGRRFAYMGDMNDIFISGGSGYTLNRAALKLLVTEGLPSFMPHRRTFSEDTMIARMFRKKFEVYPYPTQDEFGGERYMVRPSFVAFSVLLICLAMLTCHLLLFFFFSHSCQGIIGAIVFPMIPTRTGTPNIPSISRKARIIVLPKVWHFTMSRTTPCTVCTPSFITSALRAVSKRIVVIMPYTVKQLVWFSSCVLLDFHVYFYFLK